MLNGACFEWNSTAETLLCLHRLTQMRAMVPGMSEMIGCILIGVVYTMPKRLMLHRTSQNPFFYSEGLPNRMEYTKRHFYSLTFIHGQWWSIRLKMTEMRGLLEFLRETLTNSTSSIPANQNFNGQTTISLRPKSHLIHRLQMRQWWALGGRYVSHLVHTVQSSSSS